MRFLLLAIAIAFAVLCGPAASAGYSRSGAKWKMTVSIPGGKGPFPAMILLPGCSGNGPAPVKAGLASHVKALAQQGIASAVLDVLGPRHQRSICASGTALERYRNEAAKDAVAAAKLLAEDRRIDGGRIGFLGQSFGGSVALLLASRNLRPRGADIFRAIVAYYPWCLEQYGRGSHSSDFDPPVLILAGTLDKWTPASRCQRLRTEPGGRQADVRLFKDAYHSFDLVGLSYRLIAGVGGMHPVGYNAVAARASRRAYLDFLARHLSR